jgi:6-pyruvoyltetrahydropterin/6-carboxytetrahydropterin synthase
MPEQFVGEFSVSVSKDYLTFSAAHFITFRGHQCESLHGHNYRLGISVTGPIDDECLFVVDFAILKRVVRKYVEMMDHRVLLPTENPKLSFAEDGEAIRVDYFGKHTYTFPVRDCAMLPIRNTTAEMIAEWVADRVTADLLAQGATITALELEVEESVGQSATFRRAVTID